ncbi:DUF5983 family protein [Duffyella gerundensis]|uniref:DUF5983 family protein n=1 Tax=Duffyella gerundensis TaxID=1619313 RepID=UPI0016546E3A|nr:DUF5983 family protein [Duffyella gerundensis]
MKNINEVTLTGSLIGSVEPSFSSDKPFIKFTLETCEALFHADDGFTRFTSILHNVVVNGALAVRLSQELSPGVQVYVRGKQRHAGAAGQVTDVTVENGGMAFHITNLLSEDISGVTLQKKTETTPPDMTQQQSFFSSLDVKESPRGVVLSTGHMMEDDDKIMSDLCWNSETDEGKYWIQTAPGGWILRICSCVIWEHELISSGISYYAMHNLRTLEKAGYGWIHFDASAQVIKGLNFWDW